MERRRRFQRVVELVLGYSQLPDLQKGPSAAVALRRRAGGQRRRHDRLAELGILRRRDDRRRNDLRRARTEEEQRGWQELAHLTDITSGFGAQGSRSVFGVVLLGSAVLLLLLLLLLLLAVVFSRSILACGFSRADSPCEGQSRT